MSAPPVSPLASEHREMLVRAGLLQTPLRRAARVGRANGTGYAIFGGLNLVVASATGDASALVAGGVLLALGLFERRQATALGGATVGAPQRLAAAEISLLAAIVAYGLSKAVDPTSAGEAEALLGGMNALYADVGSLVGAARTFAYALLIAVALAYQGGMALYFLRQRAPLERYLEAIPPWAREVIETLTV
jgi:hypothetical protein